MPDFKGSIRVMTLFDVSDEINLADMRGLVTSNPPAPTFKHTTPEYVRFERPPVVEPVGNVTLKNGEKLSGTIQFYDYGVVSVLLRREFAGSWADVQEIASKWISGSEFEQLSSDLVRQRLSQFRPAMRKPYDTWLNEDYYVFHLAPVSQLTAAELLHECGAQIAQVVNGEVAALSDSEKNETLQARLSYYPVDLAVIGWNAAFVYDTDAGAESTVRLLEYANSQLLQFRHYDELLSSELPRFTEQWKSGPGH